MSGEQPVCKHLRVLLTTAVRLGQMRVERRSLQAARSAASGERLRPYRRDGLQYNAMQCNTIARDQASEGTPPAEVQDAGDRTAGDMIGVRGVRICDHVVRDRNQQMISALDWRYSSLNA